MSTLIMPQQEPPERTSTATNSHQEESKQIEDDLQQEKLHSLRSRLDNLIGTLAPPNVATATQAAPATQPQEQKPQPKGLLLPGRVWVVDPYGDQGQYKGDVDDEGIPHGTGDMIYVDGRKYQGGWEHGHWHGPAKCLWPNGDMFEGTFDMCKRHGPGSYQWSDGRSYVGDFFEDKRHGRGEFRWPDGSTYVGEFKGGHRDGYGNYRFPDGSIYEGGWQESQMHGQGECQWTDNRVYSGEWKNGKAHGLGKETRPDGSIRHDGLWEEDRPIKDTPDTAPAEETIDAAVLEAMVGV